MEFDLVFEGGGAKGSVFVGALKEFETRGHTARRYVGTSAGAITATLMAAGYNADELLEAVNEKLENGKPIFSTFMDIPDAFEDKDVQNSLTYAIFKKVDLPWIPEMLESKIDKRIFDQLMKLDAYREIFSFVERGGLYEGRAFLDWFRKKLDEKGQGLANATFREFHEKTGADLTLIASDTKDHEMRALNHRTAPDCPVTWGVRMSMSIPFVWQEVRWKGNWGKYMNEDISGNTIVDGGALSNFPIKFILSDDADVKAVMGETDPQGAGSLGLLIDETLSVADSGSMEEEKGTDDLEGGLLHNVKRSKTVQRISRLVDTMTDAHDRLAIEAYQDKVCHLPAKGYGTTEFDMSDQRLQALINAGQQAMKQYLDEFYPEGEAPRTMTTSG